MTPASVGYPLDTKECSPHVHSTGAENTEFLSKCISLLMVGWFCCCRGQQNFVCVGLLAWDLWCSSYPLFIDSSLVTNRPTEFSNLFLGIALLKNQFAHDVKPSIKDASGTRSTTSECFEAFYYPLHPCGFQGSLVHFRHRWSSAADTAFLFLEAVVVF